MLEQKLYFHFRFGVTESTTTEGKEEAPNCDVKLNQVGNVTLSEVKFGPQLRKVISIVTSNLSYL